ncbi:MAG: c-type cytochrome [Sphingobacterium sp.]
MAQNLKTANTCLNAHRYIVMSLFALTVLSFSACTKKQAQELTSNPDNGTETVTVLNVSYTNFSKALFETKCSSCHATGRSASARWTFSGYTSVKDNIAKINNAVLVAKSMPLGGSLTAKEIELLDAWIKRNSPEN